MLPVSLLHMCCWRIVNTCWQFHIMVTLRRIYLIKPLRTTSLFTATCCPTVRGNHFESPFPSPVPVTDNTQCAILRLLQKMCWVTDNAIVSIVTVSESRRTSAALGHKGDELKSLMATTRNDLLCCLVRHLGGRSRFLNQHVVEGVWKVVQAVDQLGLHPLLRHHF